MRTPYTYGFPGDVSFSPQNRPLELYYGSAPHARLENPMHALPSGSYAAPIGRTALAGRGMGALFAIPLEEVTGTPVMRAAYEMGKLGMATPIQMAALGDAAADRAACMATTGALVGGGGVAQQMHTQSGGGDQGWSTGIGIFNSLATTAQSMCQLIQTSGAVTPAPTGTTPPPLPPATSSVPPPQSYTGSGVSSPQSGASAQTLIPGVPNWAVILGGVAAAGLVVGLVMKK